MFANVALIWIDVGIKNHDPIVIWYIILIFGCFGLVGNCR